MEINVYPSAGMNEEQLAEKVSDKIMYKLRDGGT